MVNNNKDFIITMDDRVKIYDTVRGKDSFLYYNKVANGYATTNSSKIKKYQWSNIFSWKKKTKSSPISITDYTFQPYEESDCAKGYTKYGSVSGTTGILYEVPPPPGRIPPQNVSYPHSPHSPTSIHASIRSSSPNKHQRGSLFYSPWESLHDQSAKSYSNQCTCAPRNNGTNKYASPDRIKQSVSMGPATGASMKLSSHVSPKRRSRIELYSVEEETLHRQPHSEHESLELRSKSIDSLHRPNNSSTSCRLKSYKSSTTLSNSCGVREKLSPSKGINGNGSINKKLLTGSAPSTVNERFLRILNKAASEPFSSIASRKSILECEVNAYDLIKQHLKEVSLDDDIDSLSDNAIEDEGHTRISGVGNGVMSNMNRENVKSLSLIDSDIGFNSSSESSDMGINSCASSSGSGSMRIGGQGIHVMGSQMPSLIKRKLKTNSAKKIVRSEVSRSSTTFDSVISHGSSSVESWSAGTGAGSDEGIYSVPEPDYDTDDNESDRTGTTTNTDNAAQNTSSINFSQLKVPSYSPQLSSRVMHNGVGQSQFVHANTINECNRVKSAIDIESRFKTNNSTGVSNLNIPANGVPRDSNTSNDPLVHNRKTLQKMSSPPVPPPPPPLPTAPKSDAPKHTGAVRAPIVSFQSELRDKLNSGVKSILKKTAVNNDKPNLIEMKTDNSKDLIPNSSCDYLKTFKEFKESRLRGWRHRKHVHFRSRCDDTLIVDHISETIPEVDESEEPIYDDVQLPMGAIECNRNNDNGIGKGDDNCESESGTGEGGQQWKQTMTDLTPVGTAHNDKNKRKEIMEYSESDPSEDRTAKTWMQRVDLKRRDATLTKNLAIACKSAPSPGAAPLEVVQRGPVPVNPKNVFPFPAAIITSDNNDEDDDAADDDHDDHDRDDTDDTHQQENSCSETRRSAPSNGEVRPKCSANSTSPAIRVLDTDKVNRVKSMKSVVNGDRPFCGKSATTRLPRPISFTSSPDTGEKSDVTIENQQQKSLPLPVSQELNNNNKSISNGKVKTESELPLSNTEIEIGHGMGALHDPDDPADPRNPVCSNAPSSSSSCSANSNQINRDGLMRSSNAFTCTISINNQNTNTLSNDSTCYNPPSPSASSSSTNYNSSPYSSDNSDINSCMSQVLSIDNSKKGDDLSPISLIANPRDKIIINVPLESSYEANCTHEHIYEELDSESIYVDTQHNQHESPRKSIFEGASKDEILDYLEDAKERVEILVDGDSEIADTIDVDIDEVSIIHTKNIVENSISSNRRNRTSNVSNSSTDSSATTGSSIDMEEDILKCSIASSASVGQLVERNDSGVGTETKNKPSRLKKAISLDEVEHQCTDCDNNVEPIEDETTGLLHYPLFCQRCDKKRSERKEIISEIVETEFKYGRDLRIIREEFYRPIEIAGLLSKEQLRGVFINLDELIAVNSKFSEKLQDAIDIATEQGDEDFTTVNIGKLFRDSSVMLHAFEQYCMKQGSAALLLNQLEKEKELLRIFLRVSQMENTLLRRMNLRSFLVVPVQRVTKYPLLFNRLYKVTPYHHRDREALREAQQKVELHLEHINQQTKGSGASNKIWRRISNLSASHRRLNVDDIGNIKMRKAALEILKWNQDETQFVTIGKLLFTPINDYTINKKAKTLKFLTASALLVTLGRPNGNYRPDLVNTGEADRDLMFPRGNTGISDAVLLLIKEKNGRYVLCKEPLHLASCVISSESDSEEMFEIHEHATKESYLFKADTTIETKDWLKQLHYHAKDLGHWRRRRNALANIMMVRQ